MSIKHLGSTVTRVVQSSTTVPGSFSFDVVSNTAGTSRVIVPVSLDVVLDADAAGITGVTWDGTGDKFDKVAHGLSNGNRVVVRGSGLPVGTGINQLNEASVYVVLNSSANDFDLALVETPSTPLDLGTNNSLANVNLFRSTSRLWGSAEFTIGSQGGSEWLQSVIRSYAGTTTSYATQLTNIQGASPQTFAAASSSAIAGPAVDRGAYLTGSGDTA